MYCCPDCNISVPQHCSSESPEDDTSLCLAERRPRRLHRLLPKRFRDEIPQALPLLPPVPELLFDCPPILPSPISLPSASDSAPKSSSQAEASRARKVFRTPQNIFGLLRQYLSDKLPSHDPEEHVTLRDLYDHENRDHAADTPLLQGRSVFHPYPNKSSFLLGDWHWNRGNQKSKQGFNELIGIVSSSDFKPEDVRHTNWAKLDATLAQNEIDAISAREEGDHSEWIDADAGWNKTPINISVPFHNRTKNPGPKDYHVGDLYHRSLVSIIREKLSNMHDDKYFHYDPFELYWKKTDSGDDIRVHGELYTSPAFLDAHREVQELPGELGCDLPRVVVAMMFASDATHLTSFGTAKLWPAYLFMGNESKYRRCKPSCHLCNHVAYFQSVSIIIS